MNCPLKLFYQIEMFGEYFVSNTFINKKNPLHVCFSSYLRNMKMEKNKKKKFFL